MSKRTLFVILTTIVVPILFLLLLEGVLALLGFRPTYEYEDPFLDFHSVTSLFELTTQHDTGTEVYATRRMKLRWFNYQAFLAQKPDHGYRVFCFGGSATAGRPYGAPTAFSNWLQVLLSAGDPSRSYEVVNVGGESYASYRVVNLMQEMVNYKPDLFVVYNGHNEFLEDRTYSRLLEESPVITTVRTSLNHLRTYALVRNLWIQYHGKEKEEAQKKFQMTGEVNAILDQSFGLDRYRQDTTKASAVLSHLRKNLNRMVDIARDNDIGILFVVPASNEKDFSPFKSEFSRSLTLDQSRRWHESYMEGLKMLDNSDYTGALHAFRDLDAIDNQFADVKFRIARALFGLHEFDLAKREFLVARDIDVAPLRAMTAEEQIVREVAADRDVPLFDFQTFLEHIEQKKSGHTILGNDFFLDHVHPTIEVHQWIAEEITKVMRRSSILPTDTVAQELRTALYDSVLSRLDTTYYRVRDLNLAKVLRWAGKDREADGFVRRAAAGLPEHPEAQYLLGLMFLEGDQLDSAVVALRRSIELDSSNARAYNSLGTVYLRKSSLGKAVEMFMTSIRLDPGQEGPYYNLGNTLYQQGKVDDAIRSYREALRINPRQTKALNNLGVVYLSRRNYADAESLFRQTIALDPQNIEAFSNLGVIYYMGKDMPEARAMFERVVQLHPNDAFALSWLHRIDQNGSGEMQ